MSETLGRSGPSNTEISIEQTNNLVHGVSAEWQTMLENMAKADPPVESQATIERPLTTQLDSWDIPEYQLPGEAVEEDAFKPEIEQFALELENIDRLLIGSLGALAAISDRGGDAGMANFHAKSEKYKKSKFSIIDRIQRKRWYKENGPEDFRPGRYGDYSPDPIAVEGRQGEEAWLEPNGLAQLRLAIEGEARLKSWQAHTSGADLHKDFKPDKLISETRDKYLAQYFGVSPEELTDPEKVPSEVQQAIRGLLGLPMHEFMSIASKLGDPKAREGILARKWEKNGKAELDDFLSRNPDGKIDLEDVPAEYRGYFDDAKIKELSQKLTQLLEDEAHARKEDPNRGYDLVEVKNEKTGASKLELPNDIWQQLKKEVKTIAIRTYLPTGAPEEVQEKVSDALFLLALKEKRIKSKKRP